ncbi:hypothetical protein OK016_12375 [Vibrio chagasii]|nr:hypothetical protein [Vibrio chagasii]
MVFAIYFRRYRLHRLAFQPNKNHEYQGLLLGGNSMPMWVVAISVLATSSQSV